MGGYAAKCFICSKWFLEPGAYKDHLRDKHQIKGNAYRDYNAVLMTPEEIQRAKADYPHN